MVVEGVNEVGWECGESVADRAELAAGGNAEKLGPHAAQ